jgi:hypothetical protein
MDALYYKIQNEKYYKDVQIDQQSVVSLPYQPTNVSDRLHYINSDIEDSK